MATHVIAKCAISQSLDKTWIGECPFFIQTIDSRSEKILLSNAIHSIIKKKKKKKKKLDRVR